MFHGHGFIHIAHNAFVDDGACLWMQGVQFTKVPRCVIDGLVERGHIDAVNREQTSEESCAPAFSSCRIPCKECITYFEKNLLPLTNHEEVKELRNGFDVVDTWPAAHDERHICAARLRIERDPREVEHIEDIRVDHLVLQGESEEVKVCNGAAAFQRKKRNPLRAHLLLHVDPRRIDTLCCDLCTAI